MIKNNKLKVIISSVIILLPMLFGLVMWNELPGFVTTHFGVDGNADGFVGKAFAVFCTPAIFLGLHLLALFVTASDKRQKDQTKKALGMMFWIVPMISLFVSAVMYSVALGVEAKLEMLIPAMLGVLFMLMGNYMPKIKQNGTLGIKVIWALRNEENWNKTHRFGGKVMFIGGFAVLLSALLPVTASLAVMIGVLAAVFISTTLYSYLVYRQDRKKGIVYAPISKSKGEKVFAAIAAVVIPVLLAGIAFVMFTGSIEVSFGESSLSIEATYSEDAEVDYSKIDTVTYRRDFDIGIRASGFSSVKLTTGIFRNGELGSYTLYAYADAEEFVVLTSEGKTLVVGMSDTRDTQAFFDAISEKVK